MSIRHETHLPLLNPPEIPKRQKKKAGWVAPIKRIEKIADIYIRPYKGTL
jgi:hypothetical protein